MDTWTRITATVLITTATLVAVVGTVEMPRATTPAVVSTAPVVAPSITYIGEPSASQIALAEWAVGRFVEADLQLPPLTIEFLARCDRRGSYNMETKLIRMCTDGPITMLHELAHAWDDSGDVFDRDAFLELRGLERHVGGPRSEQGAEHLAEILAWGLMDEDTTVLAAAYPLQPLEEYELRLSWLPDSSIPELSEAFELVVGRPALHEGRRCESPAPAVAG